MKKTFLGSIELANRYDVSKAWARVVLHRIEEECPGSVTKVGVQYVIELSDLIAWEKSLGFQPKPGDVHRERARRRADATR